MKYLIFAVLISISNSTLALPTEPNRFYESADQWKKTKLPNSKEYLQMFAEVKTEIDGLIGNLEPAKVKLLLNTVMLFLKNTTPWSYNLLTGE